MNFLQKKLITKTIPGFTLVEFIVIMSIFAIMVGVVLFNFTSFRSRVTLDNLAHDIALSIRQIQTSAGTSETANLDDPTTEYFRGAAFTADNNSQVEKKITQYQSGGTTPENSGYNIGNDDVVLDTITINTADIISGISFGNSIDDAKDSTNFINSSQYPVSIAFQRFRTQAFFSTNSRQVLDSFMCIHLESPGGTDQEKRYVCISNIGQISVY